MNDLGCDLVSLVSVIKVVTTSSFLKPKRTLINTLSRTFDKSISVIEVDLC